MLTFFCLDVTSLGQEPFPVLKSNTSRVQVTSPTYVHFHVRCSKLILVPLHCMTWGTRLLPESIQKICTYTRTLHSHCTHRQSVLKDFSGEDETGNALIEYTVKLFILCTNKNISYQVVQESPLIFLGCRPHASLWDYFWGCRGLCHCSWANQNSFKALVTLMLLWVPAGIKSEWCMTLVWIAHETWMLFVC